MRQYNALEKLIQHQNWLEANNLTNTLMCQVMNRGQDGWLRKKDLEEFPYEALIQIDTIWV